MILAAVTNKRRRQEGRSRVQQQAIQIQSDPRLGGSRGYDRFFRLNQLALAAQQLPTSSSTRLVKSI